MGFRVLHPRVKLETLRPCVLMGLAWACPAAPEGAEREGPPPKADEDLPKRSLTAPPPPKIAAPAVDDVCAVDRGRLRPPYDSEVEGP